VDHSARSAVGRPEPRYEPTAAGWRWFATAAGLALALALSTAEAEAQTFSPVAAPNPLALTIGGPGAAVVVTTNPEPGFLEVVNYTFLGLPAFIQFGGPQSSLPPAYPPSSFPFSLGIGAVPGTYSGVLRGVAGPTIVDLPFQVLVASAPSFAAAASPNPVSLTVGGPGAAVTVSTAPDPGFSTPITYAFIGFPGFIAFGGAQVASAPGYAPLSFPVSLGAGAAAGNYSGALRGTSGAITVDVPFQVIVGAAAGFRASVVPNPLGLALGGPGATVTVRTTPDPGFTGSIVYAFRGLPGSISFGGSQVASPPYAPLTFAFSLGPGALPGTYHGVLRGTSGGAISEIPFRVRVTSAPSFDVQIAPNPVEMAIGGPAVPVTVTTLPELGFTAPVSYAFTALPAFVQTGAGQVAGPPAFAPLSFPFRLGPGAVPGAYPGGLEVRVGGAVVRAIPFTVIVRPPLPTIEQALPAILASGGRSQVVRFIGRHFEPGAAVSSDTPAVIVEEVQVLSAELAQVTLSVRPDAPAGPVRLRLTNPGGRTTPVGGLVTVLPADSLVAPLSVTSTVVAFPRSGSQIARGDDVYPRGLLTVTGSGPILGSWLLDGAVFDRFAVHAVAGQPVPVAGRVSIPHLGLGSHALVLEVTHPQGVASSPVEIVQTVESASQLRALLPAERAIVGRQALVFEWTLVPGAAAYELEVQPPGTGLPRRWESPVPRWQPDASERAELGAGLLRWRVRALFAGEVRGEPTPWRELAVLPAAAQLSLGEPRWDGEAGGWRIRWSGGAPGIVYRVLVQPAAEAGPQLTALTLRQEYLLTHGRLRAGGRYRIEVEALGPEGERLGGSEPLEFQVPADGGGATFAKATGGAEAIEIVAVGPPAGSVSDSARAVIEASWSPALAADQVLLFVDGAEVSGVCELGPRSIRYLPRVPLEPGEHAVELRLAGSTTGWRFTVVGVEPGAAGVALPEAFLDGRFNGELSASAQGGDEPRDAEQLRLAVSAQLGAQQAAGAVQTTADLSWSRPLGGDSSPLQESESWLARAAGRSGPAAGELAAGYGTPTFLAETEFLAAGLARGGAEGAVGSPGGARVAYYRSFDSELGDAAAGVFGVDQDLQAAAFEAGGEGRRFVLRAVGLEVGQEATPFDAGGEGRSYGLFGRFRLGPGMDLVLEGARGEFEPGEGSFEALREGDAYRLGLAGSAGTVTYSLDLRHVEEGFVNPANRGLTPGGRSDRDVLELALVKGFARSRLQARLQHFAGGDGIGLPSTVDAVHLDYGATLGPAFALTLGGNFAATRADADADLFLPETDRRDWGLTASATATLGRFQLTPAAALQRQEHDLGAEATTSSLGLSAFAAESGGFSLSASLTGTRVDGDPLAGRTDALVLSLQPAWEIAAAALRLQPLVTYADTTNELLGLDTTSERYLLTVAWNPRWLGSLVGLELTGDWSRTRSGGAPGDGFLERYTTVLVLRRGGATIRPRPPVSPPPVAGSRVGSRLRL
jgi:hypothetical protein